MGKIRQLREDQIVNGGSQEHIYPVTHTKAVYSKDRENLQDIIDSIREGNFLKDGSIKTRHLKDKAVTTSKLDDGSVDNRVLATDAVETENILDNAVSTSKIANQGVTKEKIADQSVDNSKLSPSAVTYDKLKDKSVITEKLNDRAVTTEKVEEKAITNTKLGDQSVDGRVVREASIEGKHIGNNAVSTSKIASRSVTNEKIAHNSVSRAELTPDVRNSIDKKADAEQVNNSLYDLEKKIGDRFVVEGDVTNLPDEEDLTSVKESERDVLKLADRSYAPEKFSGKGYKILRRNIKPVSIAVTKIQIETVPSADGTLSFTVNGKETQVAVSATTDNTTALVSQKVASAFQESITEYEVSVDASLITLTRKSDGSVTPSVFSASTTGLVCTVTDSTKREFRNILTPIMLNQPNTIYEIRYAFTLSENITIPNNCVLKFEGGSISGAYTITGSNTCIQAELLKIFDTNVTFAGTWDVSEAYPEWFGDDIQKTVDSFPVISLIRHKVYQSSKSIILNAGNIIKGNNAYLRSTIQSGAAVVLGNNNRIIDISISLAERYDTDRAVVLLDVSNKKRTKDENKFNINSCYFVTETFVLKNVSLENPPRSYNSNYADVALKIVGNTQIEDNDYGLWGNIINNFRIYGNFKYGIYIDCPNSTVKNWITCSNFMNGTIADAQIGIYIDKSGEVNQVAPHGLNFENIHYQTLGNEIREQIETNGEYSRFALLKNCTFISFKNCTIVDWVAYKNKTVLQSAAPFLINPNKATQISITDCVLSTTFSRFFDSLEPLNSDSYQLPAVKYSNYAMRDNFNLDDYINVPSSTTSEENEELHKQLLRLPEGKYVVPSNPQVVLKALGNPNLQSGDFVIGIRSTAANMKIIELFSSNFTTIENGKSKYLVSTYNSPKNTTYSPKLIWEKGKSYIDFDFNSNRPSLDFTGAGYMFLDADKKRIAIWNGTAYVDTNWFTCDKIKGTLEEAESIKNSLKLVLDKGYRFYAEDLFKWIYLKIVQEGSTIIRTWVEEDGAKAGVKRNGTFAEKPVSSDIYIGFKYFCTDKQTTEGSTNGIMIYHKGDNVWVDALGRVVS